MAYRDDEEKRIYELETAESLSAGTFVPVDKEGNEMAEKFDLGTALDEKVDVPSTEPEAGQVLTFDGNKTIWDNPPEGVYVLNYMEIRDLNDIDVDRVKTQPTFMKIDTTEPLTISIPQYNDTSYTVSVQPGTIMGVEEIGPEGTAGSYTGPSFIVFSSCYGKGTSGSIMQNADLKIMCVVSLSTFNGVSKSLAANGYLNYNGGMFGSMPAPVTFKASNGRGVSWPDVAGNEDKNALIVEIQSGGLFRRQCLLPLDVQNHDFSTDTTPEQIQFMGWGATSNRAGYRTIREVPSSTAQDEGKVLTVDPSGAHVWRNRTPPVTFYHHWEKVNGDYDDNTEYLDFDVSSSGIKSAIVVIQMTMNAGKYVFFNVEGINMTNSTFGVTENYAHNNSDFNGIKPSVTNIMDCQYSGIKAIRIKHHGSQQHKFSTETSGIDIKVIGFK